MENDIEMITTRFRNEAAGLFAMTAIDCTHHLKAINRQLDENVFQQIQGRYIHQLRHQLNQIAKQEMSLYTNNRDRNLLNRELTKQVDYYVSELLLKTRSL